MSGEAGFLKPRILLPFLLITCIWGSTWIVIRDQIGADTGGGVPPPWSVAYRFIIASAAMFAYAAATRVPLRIGREGHALAFAFGVPQFVLNFNLVYAAEHHVTSGLVATLFALLVVPNALLGWLFLKQRLTAGFLAGSAVALAGVALLFIQEARVSGGGSRAAALGIALTLAAVLAASVSNVMQASERLRRRPIAAMLAWGMCYGAGANALVALALHGAPVAEARLFYWLGLLYLGLFASALSFAFYFAIIREIGPAKSAYSSVLVPIIAMALSTVFEGYRWSTLAVAGGILAVVGLVIALGSRRPEPAVAPPGGAA